MRMWPLMLGLVIWLAPALVSAEEGEVEATQTQLDLNDRGVQAIGEEDYDSAIRLFEASIDIGELNITYLNLGRAYQYRGDCQEAQRYFNAALEAPAIERPGPAQIAEAVERFKAELEEECVGYLEVVCEPGNAPLFIDGEGPEWCDLGAPRELSPGRYELELRLDEESDQAAVEISVGKSHTAHLRVEGMDDDEGMDHLDEMPEVAGGNSPRGWIYSGVGVAALGAGIAMDNIPDDARSNEVNSVNLAAVGMYGITAGMTVLAWRAFRR